ncbi:organic cation/carnitine transporter, putative, partial [Ixodes scapularis]
PLRARNKGKQTIAKPDRKGRICLKNTVRVYPFPDSLHALQAWKIMDFEDVLEEIGGYGRFQKMLVWIYLAPASILMPGYFMSQIFMLSAPQHSCKVAELTDVFNLTQQEANVLHKSLVSKDNCEVFSLSAINSSLIRGFLNHGGNDSEAWFESQGLERVPCTEFTYDNTFYDSTASTQWDLVCDRSHLPSLVFTLTSVGSALGTLIFGGLSDRIGRRPAFFVTGIVAVIFGISSILGTNFIAFTVLRLVTATIMPQIFQLPYIILLELVGPKYRTSMLGIAWMAWTLGLCALPLAAYLCRTWILLGLICSACAALNFLYWKLIPESPRWLLTQNRVKEAVVLLKRIAKTNGVVPPEHLETDLMKVQKKLEEERSEAVTSTMDILRMSNIRTNFLIVTFSWIANSCAYYGLSINVTNMSGNEFINFFLLGLVEFPACVISWWSMEKFGRRWMNVFFQAMVSFSCLGFCFVPPGAVVSGVVVLMLAKFSCTASAMVMYQQASEVMPTPVRSFALGASSSLASSFSICMPYIIYLGKYGTWIPFMVMIVLATLAGVSSMWLPETNGFALCQTMDDANEFGKDQKFFSFNRIKKVDKTYGDKKPKEKEMELMVNDATEK